MQPVLPALLPAAETIPAEPRGPGRPAGALNLRSEVYAALLRAEHGDPLKIATVPGSLLAGYVAARTLDQLDHVPLGGVVAFDVALRRRQRSMAGELLDV